MNIFRCTPISSVNSDVIQQDFEQQCIVRPDKRSSNIQESSAVVTTTTTAPHLPMPTRPTGNGSSGKPEFE